MSVSDLSSGPESPAHEAAGKAAASGAVAGTTASGGGKAAANWLSSSSSDSSDSSDRSVYVPNAGTSAVSSSSLSDDDDSGMTFGAYAHRASSTGTSRLRSSDKAASVVPGLGMRFRSGQPPKIPEYSGERDSKVIKHWVRRVKVWKRLSRP